MSKYSQFNPYNDLPGDPENWTYEPPVLSASVGWQQPNFPEDVVLIQRVLNVILDNGYLEALAIGRLAEDGSWDGGMSWALDALEMRYLSGMASPFGQGILNNDSPLFHFLVHLAAGNANLVTQYSPMMYQLARVMLPNANHGLRLHLANILQALSFNGIADAQMVLMALATMRAEVSGATPVSEGISKFNSSPAAKLHRPGTHTFDLYDNRSDIGNRGFPDGAAFKGRGFVQLTGRAHYSEYARIFHWPLVEYPDTANDAWVAAMLLSRFLKDHESKIRDALRRGDLRTARKAVNGGSYGLVEFVVAMQAGRAFLRDHIAGDALARLLALRELGGR